MKEIDALGLTLKEVIRDVPDFPKKGILFKDITPLLKNGPLFKKTIEFFAKRYELPHPDQIGAGYQPVEPLLPLWEKAGMRGNLSHPHPRIEYGASSDPLPSRERKHKVIPSQDHGELRVKDHPLDAIVCIESRGFLLGAPLAAQLGIGIIPVRKKGKLPRSTFQATYQLEYGLDCLEIHKEDLKKGDRVLLVDDVLATGGTISAVIELVKNLGCEIVEITFLIELLFLEGRKKLGSHSVFSLIQY